MKKQIGPGQNILSFFALQNHSEYRTEGWKDYTFIIGNKGKNKDKIVGLVKDNALTLYLKQKDRSKIWNHNGVVALTLVKNMTFYYGDNNVVQHDVVALNGLCGAVTPLELACDSLVLREGNCHAIEKEDLGSLEEGETVYKQIVTSFGFPSDFAFSHDITFSGHNNFYYFPVGEPKTTDLSGKELGEKLYSYLRGKNDWYWGHGYNTAGSAETREKITATKRTNLAKGSPLYNKMCQGAIGGRTSSLDMLKNWQTKRYIGGAGNILKLS